jgi:tryptophan halogenase
MDSLRDYYNQRMAVIYHEVRDFVQMHYRLSRRTDSAFWIAAREAEISVDLKRRLSLYDEVGILDHLQAEAFPETSYFHLLTGNKRLPRRAPALAASADPHMVHSILASIKAQNEQALLTLPLHEELLGRIHRIPLAKAS